MTQPDTHAQDLLKVVLGALEDLKALNIVTLDVHEQTDFTDFMVVATGTSSTHVKAVANEVAEQAKKAHFPVLGIEGYTHGEWVLIDLDDIVVHVMLKATRDFYQLEKLWGTF